ncbi:Phage terminase large subunit (GpA) [Durusdinium trenchii]|uniref:Phage terminase large subunit (GpA) n=1 Tax=Durusdinium trenchii TaxID=1381693 RepID=A0ABP0S7M2_9DINO
MDRRRRFDRRKAVEAAEVGPIPGIVHPARREACRQDLLLFLQTYFPDTTGLDLFSADHIRVIDRIEYCLRNGGRFVNAVYRGFAKTTITENAALWATLYGYRRFVAIFGSDQAAANQLIDSITRELEENPLLAEDFPEVCTPFQHLDGKPQRCRSQTQQDEHTHIRMGSDILVMPTIWLDDARTRCTPSSGCIIRARGLLAGTRGIAYKRADGEKIRPDFALIDDPQTDESAASLPGIEKRLGLIRKAILKSAGHRTAMACVMNATVIQADDVVDQLLDPERNPAWQGERIKMVRSWSDAHETLWQEYARIRHSYNRDIPGDADRAVRAATGFYLAHRAEMDAGCELSWQGCYDRSTEVSAIQHAYNLYFDDPPEVFESECQNEPATAQPAGVEKLDALTVARRLNGFRRGIVPEAASHLTGFIDVHDDVLYWLVCSWSTGCTGAVVDYGTWPDQQRRYFSKRQATKTLGRKYPGQGREAALTAGLEACVNLLCDREWSREDGSPQRLDKLLIDCGHSPDEVELVCRRSRFASALQMSRGVGITASDTPIREYQRKRGWRFGEEWYIKPGGNRALRPVRFDSNHWKTWTHARLATPVASPGSLSLFGTAGRADHRLLSEHLVSEKPTETEGRGRTVISWACPPGRDNHWWDCLVGNGVAASMLGLSLSTEVRRRTSRRRRALAAARTAGRLGGTLETAAQSPASQ